MEHERKFRNEGEAEKYKETAHKLRDLTIRFNLLGVYDYDRLRKEYPEYSEILEDQDKYSELIKSILVEIKRGRSEFVEQVEEAFPPETKRLWGALSKRELEEYPPKEGDDPERFARNIKEGYEFLIEGLIRLEENLADPKVYLDKRSSRAESNRSLDDTDENTRLEQDFYKYN